MPKKSSYNKKSKILVVMEYELREKIKNESKENERNMSSQIVYMIKKYMDNKNG